LELWIPITLAAAFLQNVRSGLQRHLKGVMGTTGATFVRFGFGAPFAVALVLVLHFWVGYEFPAISLRFLVWMVVGGLAQIGATFLLIHLFSFRNFAVGTAYSRTEPAMAALFGLLFLGEGVSAATLVAIGICVFGVMLISVARTSVSFVSLFSSLAQRNALIGLLSGALFGLAAISYRGASLALGGPNFLMQASVTLAFVIVLQSVLLIGWMIWREPQQFAFIYKALRPSLLVGLAGATASLGWFMAMTLQNAAVVKALAQVEMLFAFGTSVLIFKEKINRLEIIGCCLIVLGIIVMMVLRAG
jgi:drug/metabolite transporter (DMT)-like permease